MNVRTPNNWDVVTKTPHIGDTRLTTRNSLRESKTAYLKKNMLYMGKSDSRYQLKILILNRWDVHDSIFGFTHNQEKSVRIQTRRSKEYGRLLHVLIHHIHNKNLE
jgi:hypothetical protein